VANGVRQDHHLNPSPEAQAAHTAAADLPEFVLDGLDYGLQGLLVCLCVHAQEVVELLLEGAEAIAGRGRGSLEPLGGVPYARLLVRPEEKPLQDVVARDFEHGWVAVLSLVTSAQLRATVLAAPVLQLGNTWFEAAARLDNLVVKCLQA